MSFDLTILLRNVDSLMLGFYWTVLMIVGALAFGSVLGGLACFAKIALHGPLKWIANGYIEFYRTIPEMVNIFWIFYCIPLIFDLRLSAVASGVLALSLYSGAFLAEIYRAGIAAVPPGQVEAAYASGLPRWAIWVYIIMPQALRLMVPAFITFLTDLVKVSGLLSAIGVAELVYQASILSNATWKHFEFFTAVGVLYFIIIAPLSLLSQEAARRVARARR